MTTIAQNRKKFFILLCLLLFSNGIGFLWKRRVTEKNNGLNNVQNVENFSNWKGIVLETNTNMILNEGNTSFIKLNNEFELIFNNKCDNIQDHPNKCEFVRKYCQNTPGLINYLQFYFCNSKEWKLLIIILLFLWLLFLFGFTGIAASDFFCPNLNTIATKLNLSESLAGMTFLAFGNGSPDLFSTFSAVSHGSGSLAVGELIGAASFITSVVAGSVAVVSPFHIKKGPFLRDVIFFLLAICIVLTIIWDGKIYPWESIILVLLYIAYVGMVVIGTWWIEDQERRKLQEQKAIAENLHRQEELEDQGYDEVDSLLSENTRIPDYMSRNVTREENESNDLFPHRHHNHRRTRHSLFGAIEFRDVVNSLRSDSSERALSVFGRNYTTDFYNSSGRPRSRTIDSPFNNGGGITSIPIVNTNNPNNDNSTGQEVINESILNVRSLPNYSTQTPAFLTLTPPTDRTTSSSLPPGSDLLPIPSPNNSNFILNDLLHSSPSNSPLQTPLNSPGLTPTIPPDTSFCNKVCALLFPYLEGFSQKSFIAKIIAILSTPTTLILTLTLPVVESEELSDYTEKKKHNTIDSQLQAPSIVIEDTETAVETQDEEKKETRWNRWLTTAQFVFSPLFVSSVLFSESNKIILFSFIGGVIASIICILFTRDDKPPRFNSLLCFIGFGVSIVWIFLVANEVVGLLQAIGLIMGLSDAIIGLTIFAMGNSLGDFVANITIAKMGYPTMAVSACFGGPMLNILLGIGIAGTYTTLIHHGKAIDIKIEPTLFVSSIGLLLTLCSYLIYLPRNGYYMTRKWGYFIISIYLICMVINIILELIMINNKSSLLV